MKRFLAFALVVSFLVLAGCGQAQPTYATYKHLTYRVPDGYDFEAIDDGTIYTHCSDTQLLEVTSTPAPDEPVTEEALTDTVRGLLGNAPESARAENVGSIEGLVYSGEIPIDGEDIATCGFIFCADAEIYCVAVLSMGGPKEETESVLTNVMDSLSCDVATTPLQQSEPEDAADETLDETVPEEDPDMVQGIPGSNSTDLLVGMTGAGFPVYDHKTTDDDGTQYWQCQKESTLGATMSYLVHQNDAKEITKVVFDYQCAIGADAESSNTLAALEGPTFLGFCATFGYTDSDTDTARQWVLDNSEAAFAGDTIETDIGGAHFTLDGYTGEAGYYTYLTLKVEPN